MVKGKVTDETLREIAKYEGYLAQGKTIIEMGEIEHVPKQTISYRLKKLGLTPNKTKQAEVSKKEVLDKKSQKENLDSISKSRHKNSPGSNDENKQSDEIMEIIKTAILEGKDIPPNVLYLIAVQNFTANPSPQWFSALQTFMKDKEKIAKADNKESNKPLVYLRPPKFHAKQHEVVEAIKDPRYKLIFVEGCQRSGKSTSVFAGLHELTLESPRPLRIALLAGKGGKNGRDGGSKGILADVLRDPILDKVNKQVLDLSSRTNDTIKWYNGSELVAMDLTVASIKGADKEIVWIDELDVAISEGNDKREAVVSAVNTMLATSDFKLILSSNLDKGLYQILRDEIFKLQEECVCSISIRKEDCPHLNREDIASNYRIAKTMSDALLGEGFGQMRLEGEMTGQGDCFNFAAVNDAFDRYTLYMSIINNKLPPIRFMAIDPSGTGHPFGVFIGAYDPDKDEHVEIESFEIQMGDPNTRIQEKSSPQRINELLLTKCRENGIKKVVIESNSGGQAIAIFLRNYGIQVIEQNFGGKQCYNSRANYVTLANYLLDNRKIVLKNDKLKSELIIYNPSINKEEFKGDVADAFLHYCWIAVGGMTYLAKKARQSNKSPTYTKSFCVG